MSVKTDIIKSVVAVKKNKIALIATISIVAGGLTFGIVKGVRYARSKNAQKEAETDKEKMLEQASENVLERKMSDIDAKTYAKDLLDAMDGWGTDEDVIKDILLDRNPSVTDIKAIFDAFGTPEYGTFGRPMWGSGTPMNLIEWIKKEVDNTTSLYEGLKVKFQTAGFTF